MRIKARTTIKKKRDKKNLIFRKKFCRLCVNKVKTIDYKDLKALEAYIRERGKILSSRISGNCARHQRILGRALKQARFIALVPYVRY